MKQYSDRIKLGLKRFLVSWKLKYESRNGIFPVEISSTVGLGAKLEWCLEILAYCDEKGIIPQFKFSYPNSESSEDYFSPFFRIKGTQERPARFVKISSIIELNLGKDYDHLLNIKLANKLIEKYLVVREEIMREVEIFCCQHFTNRKVLGVHYRGTDKFLESPVVPYDRVRRNIRHYLKMFPLFDSIFIATDDVHFIENMETSPIGRPIIYRNDSFRSRDGNSIHESALTDKYEINRDAIVNCLLLSRCDALLKTSSILSDWSKLFNPRLPIVLLNIPYNEHLWFPERDLIQESLFESVQ